MQPPTSSPIKGMHAMSPPLTCTVRAVDSPLCPEVRRQRVLTQLKRLAERIFLRAVAQAPLHNVIGPWMAGPPWRPLGVQLTGIAFGQHVRKKAITRSFLSCTKRL